MKLSASIYMLVLWLLLSQLVSAQLVNQGQLIYSAPSSLVFINGDVVNETDGVFEHKGQIELKGNWRNNNSVLPFFTANSTGSVLLSGSNQYIGRCDPALFYDLILAGSGVKFLEINHLVKNRLLLNDRELSTGFSTLTIENRSIAAIDRTSGFVSSDIGGALIRYTNARSTYYFPTGRAGLYRPLVVTPDQNINSAYGVRLAANSADNEGLPTSLVNNLDARLNQKFFHTLTYPQGFVPAQMNVLFNLGQDGDFDQSASWLPLLWILDINSQKNNGSYGDGLNASVISHINNSPDALILAGIDLKDIKLDIPNAFSPNGDGVNDTFVIEGLKSVDNSITIFNRWGTEVYRSTNYQNDWNGSELPGGTYYYVLRIKNKSGKFVGNASYVTIVR